MEICFLRHGDAEGKQPGEIDAERDLTDLGRRQANEVAGWLVDHGIAPEALLVSPRNRAVQSAEPTAAALDLELQTDDRLSGGELTQASLDELITDAGNPQSILLVGHEPDFSDMIARLTGGNVHMATGALAMVDTTSTISPNGVLEFLVPPHLRA